MARVLVEIDGDFEMICDWIDTSTPGEVKAIRHTSKDLGDRILLDEYTDSAKNLANMVTEMRQRRLERG